MPEGWLDRGLIESATARDYFQRIEPALYRFAAIDPLVYRRAVDEMFPP